MLLLSSYYFPPVSYFAVLANVKDVQIECHDSYIKQTYRNRCRILGPNGVLNLVIPINKEHGKKTIVKDVRIDYATDWQRNHLKGIEAAYKSAPFYEFYMDTFEYIYHSRIKYLLELNQKILEQTIDFLELDINTSLSKSFIANSDNDLREVIHPKYGFSHTNYLFQPLPYYQVFQDKFGFQHDLSILDLLLNEGPRSTSILKQSLKQTPVDR